MQDDVAISETTLKCINSDCNGPLEGEYTFNNSKLRVRHISIEIVVHNDNGWPLRPILDLGGGQAFKR